MSSRHRPPPPRSRKRELFAEGHDVGITGVYEKIAGKAYGDVDPKARHNKDIVNVAKAPKNQRGRVEYSMDVFILKPLDMARGKPTVFYDVVNRGNRGCASTMALSAATI